jgi:hypothetical protein
MGIFVKINNNLYPAFITGKIHDKDWDERASKAIKVEMDYTTALSLFVDDIEWSIVQESEETVEEIIEKEVEVTDIDANGEEVTRTEIIEEVILVPKVITEEYDNSEYSIAGDIIDHRNGYVTIKMGKPTAEEILTMLEEVL